MPRGPDWTGPECAALKKAWAAALPEATGDAFVQAVMAIMGATRSVCAVREYARRRYGLQPKTIRNCCPIGIRCKACGAWLATRGEVPALDVIGAWIEVHRACARGKA